MKNSVAEKEKKVFDSLKGIFKYKNAMASPRLTKISVSSGVGTLIKKDKHKGEFVALRLAEITGQRPVPRGAKKAIASFKSRQGEIIGYSTTLRGKRMYSFLDKLLNVALPRTRDFRGISPKIIDDMGNLTISIKENNIFPEAANEELKNVFGFAVTIVSTAKNKTEALAFFKHLGVPFKEEQGK